MYADLCIKYMPKNTLYYAPELGAGSSELKITLGDDYGVRTLTSLWTDYKMFIYTDLVAECSLDRATNEVTCLNYEDILGNTEYEMWIVQMIMAAGELE